MTSSFTGVVRLNEHGELVCFCYSRDVELGKCDCRKRFDCPMAEVQITTLPGTRPSELTASKANKPLEDLSSALESATKQTEKIKAGLLEIEKSMRKPGFRI